MDGGEFAQVLMGLRGVTAAARVLVGAGYEWTTHPCRGFGRRRPWRVFRWRQGQAHYSGNSVLVRATPWPARHEPPARR